MTKDEGRAALAVRATVAARVTAAVLAAARGVRVAGAAQVTGTVRAAGALRTGGAVQVTRTVRVSGALLAGVLASGAAGAAEQPVLREIALAPDPVELEATVRALVGFGTRHSLSDTASSKRGIGAARRWVQARFERISRDCGGCLAGATPSRSFTGEAAPKGVNIVDVVAIQKGEGDPKRVIILTGHLDSRVTDLMNAASDAPGADDDASGVAAVIEAARVLSRHKFQASTEDYRHQHQDLRTEGGIEYGDTLRHLDFPYLARVTATNALTAASMAAAPAPPAHVEIAGEVTPDTKLSWRPGRGAHPAGYRVYWRDTAGAEWAHSRDAGVLENRGSLSVAGPPPRRGRGRQPIAHE
jgi:hypothetical protein